MKVVTRKPQITHDYGSLKEIYRISQLFVKKSCIEIGCEILVYEIASDCTYISTVYTSI